MGGLRASGDGPRPGEAPSKADSERKLSGEAGSVDHESPTLVTFCLESWSWTVWARHVSPAPRVSVSARVAPCQRGHVSHVARTGDREEAGATSPALCEISSGLTETGIIHTTLTRIKVKFCSSISMFHCSPEMFNFKFRHLIKWRSSSPFMFYV